MIIYKVINKLNGNVYIGKTFKSLHIRKLQHLNKIQNNNCNTYFHKAIRKYGVDNFEWSILTKTDSESKLNVLEKFYIVAYKKTTKLYNMTDGGEGTFGFKPTKETRLKISKANKGKKPWNKNKKHSFETREKIKIKAIGRKKSEETKIKLKNSNSGEKAFWYGKKLSKEHREKISKTRKEKNIKHTEESKKKMSQSRCGKNNVNFGKIFTEEHRKKLSQSKKGKHIHTDESKLKMSLSRSGENNPMSKLNINKRKIKNFLEENFLR